MTELYIARPGELALEGTVGLSQYGLCNEGKTITNETHEEYYNLQVLPNMYYNHTLYPQVKSVVFFLQFSAPNHSMHFSSPITINSSKLNYRCGNKIILGNIVTLLDLPVWTNGDSASDIQFPIAILAVFGIHFKLCTYLLILEHRTLITLPVTVQRQMSFSSNTWNSWGKKMQY